MIWLQTKPYFADLRIPVDRLDLSDRRGPDDCDLKELLLVAAARGFAGSLVQRRRGFEWLRTIDFQPPTGGRDAGLLWAERGTLYERGLELEYDEAYDRIETGIVATGVFMLEHSDRLGLAVRIDDFILLAIGRSEPLPIAGSLAELVAVAGNDKARQSFLFDCEVSLARLPRLIVSRSTLPWREGRPMFQPFFAITERRGPLIIERTHPEERCWRLMSGSDFLTSASVPNFGA